MRNIRSRLFTLVLSLLATTVQAQTHTVVQPDRILIGSEFVPRCLNLPQVLAVPAGKVVTAPADSTWDCIEVAGTLRVSRTTDTVLRFTHLFVLPGGVLDVGTQADPIPADRHVELIVRDVPIDTSRDPFQWGNGLLNFGRQTRVGCSKTPWAEAAGGLAAGATTITLAAAPENWKVGDELLIPDTVTPFLGPDRQKTVSQRETSATISAISGTVLTLSKGLDFAHPNVSDPDGTIRLRPRVANLTRCIAIRSENSDHPLTGVRGHTVDIGHGATWDVRFNQFVQLGRTLNGPLNDTVIGPTGPTKLGTNERGRYAHHHHHAGSSVGSADVGNVYQSTPATTKWGLVVHGTSDILVEGNIAVDFAGAGFITEDGYEVRNVFRKNFAAYILSTPPVVNPAENVTLNRPGAEGVGFWFRGVKNVIEGNEAWNNYRAGIMLFNQNQPAGQYPSVPKGMPDTPVNPETAVPLSFKDNVLGANVGGLELWGTTRFPIVNVIAGNNYDRAVFPAQSHLVALDLVNPTIVCERGKGLYETSTGSGGMGVHSADGYVGTADVTGGSITGCAIGIGEGGSVNGLNVTGTVLQNEIDILRVHRHLSVKNVTFQPLGTLPKRFIELVTGDYRAGSVWPGEPTPMPNYGISWFSLNRGSDLIVETSPGFGDVGKSYRIYLNQSKAGNPSPFSGASGNHIYHPPAKGLTVQQVWDRFGMGFNGGVAPTTATTIDGLTYGVAAEGTTTALGPPRAIITYPNDYEPVFLEGGAMRVQVVMTGDPAAASSVLFVSVDGKRPMQVHQRVDGDSPLNDQRTFGLDGDAIKEGAHTLKAWRTKVTDPRAVVPGSEYTVTYSVRPAPVLTAVPAIVKLTKDAATAAITGAGLVVGMVGSAESDTVPTGQVITQLPTAGAKVAPGSSVSMTVSTGVTMVKVPNVVAKED